MRVVQRRLARGCTARTRAARSPTSRPGSAGPALAAASRRAAAVRRARPLNQVGIGGISHRVSCGQQPFQRDQILALEGRRVLVEQRPPYGLVRLAELVFGRREPGQLGTRPLERAVDRRGRGVEQVGDLGRRPGQHLPQDQYGALPRRQVLQRGDHRQPQALPSRRPPWPGRRRAAGPGTAPASGTSSACGSSSSGSLPGAPSADGTIRRLLCCRSVQADPGRDPVEPGPDRRALLEVRVPAPGPQVRLLHRVLGVVQRAEHPVAVRDQLTPVLRELVLQVHRNSSTTSCRATRPRSVRRRAAMPSPASAPSNDSTPHTARARVNPCERRSPPAAANTAARTATPTTPPSCRIML